MPVVNTVKVGFFFKKDCSSSAFFLYAIVKTGFLHKIVKLVRGVFFYMHVNLTLVLSDRSLKMPPSEQVYLF